MNRWFGFVVFLVSTAAIRCEAQGIGFNCGSSSEVTTADGLVYGVDRVYSESRGAGRIGGQGESRGNGGMLIGGVIEGGQDPGLLRSMAVGWQEYRFDVPDGGRPPS